MKILPASAYPVPSLASLNLLAEPGFTDKGAILSVADKETTGRALVPVRQRALPIIHGPRVQRSVDQEASKELRTTALNMRAISPRKLAETGYDLYTIGAIGWEEYEMLAFQPELHPDYNKTIGALVGDVAQPDRPQDFIEIWQGKLQYERRYNPDDRRKIRQTEHLISILRQIDNPTNLVA